MSVKFAGDRSRYYSQENNAVEAFLKVLKKTEGLGHWTESCGPTSAVMIMDQMGFLEDWKVKINVQLEDYLWAALNDPRNVQEFQKTRVDIVPLETFPGNRIPQYYPVAVKIAFGVNSVYYSSLKWVDVIECVKKGQGVQIRLIDPGHFVAVTDYDEVKSELIFCDPFPNRFPDGNGFRRHMTKDEFEKNTRKDGIVYKGV
jgi:hypothetical protein